MLLQCYNNNNNIAAIFCAVWVLRIKFCERERERERDANTFLSSLESTMNALHEFTSQLLLDRNVWNVLIRMVPGSTAKVASNTNTGIHSVTCMFCERTKSSPSSRFEIDTSAQSRRTSRATACTQLMPRTTCCCIATRRRWHECTWLDGPSSNIQGVPGIFRPKKKRQILWPI